MFSELKVCIIGEVGRRIKHRNGNMVFENAEQSSSRAGNRISELCFKVRYYKDLNMLSSKLKSKTKLELKRLSIGFIT